MAEIIKGKKGYTDAQICCFMYGLVVLMMAVLGSPLGISYILDETGTVANAAYLAGYNWNDWVNHTGGYFYKYGQAIFYYPIMKMVSNPYLIYKFMMFMNGLILGWIPVMAYLILRKHLNQEDKAKCTLIALCISVIPATVLYSLYARGDIMLIAFAWITLYVMLESMEAEGKRKQIVLSGLTAFVSVYMYMCHSRGIVFIIAVFMVVFIMRFILRNKRICYSAYFVSLIASLYIDDRLTHYFKDNIWGDGIKKNTFANVNTHKYANLFTAEGLETVVKHVTGWLFNSFLGTYGFIILGIFFAFAGIVCYITKKKDITGKEIVINMYAVLVYFGTLAMGVLFSFGSNYRFIIGEKVKRADRFLYSRYVAPAYALLVLIALYYLFLKKDCFVKKTKIAALCTGGVLIVYCRTWLKDVVNNVEYSWRNTIDSGLFFDPVRYGNDANKYSNVSRALLMAAILAFAVLLIVMVLAHITKGKKMVLVLVGGCFLFSLSVNYVKLRLATDARPMQMVGGSITQMYKLENKTGISEMYHDVYIDKTVSRHKMMQIAMPMYTVHVNRSVAPEDVNNMFIIAKNYTVNEAWMDEDCYVLEDYDFENTQTTVIIKGEALRTELEKRGISLVQIPQDYTNKELPKQKIIFRQGLKRSLKYQWESVKSN